MRKAITSSDGAHVGTKEGIERHPDSGSGSDDSDDAKRRREVHEGMAGEAHDVIHQIKKIEDLLQKHYSKDDVKVLCDMCSSLQKQKTILTNQWVDIYRVLREDISSAREASDGVPDVERIGARIKELHEEKVHETERLKEQLAVVAVRASEATKRAEEDARHREAAEQRSAEDVRRKEAAEQEAAELAAQVVRLKAEKAARVGDAKAVSARTKRSGDGETERIDAVRDGEHQDDARRKRRR